ncbi:MAG TPA: hypothetical protein VL049_17735 [Candidatus Dormibacteraeota bacterium]|nr:hypothetical protein [Candidatus Dormibacteraeota bacterium]
MSLLLKRLLLVAAALVAAAILLEIGARLLDGGQRTARASRLFDRPDQDPEVPQAQALDDQRIMLHPYFGYVVDPRAPGINPYGFFRRAPLTTRSPDRYVIAFFGGSVADQVFALGQGALIAALQRDPAFADRQIEVLSTALGGYKQPQQLLVLADLLALGAQFDVVVNLDGFNEVDGAADNVQDGVNPYYPHHWQVQARRALDRGMLVHAARIEAARDQRDTLRQMFAGWPVVRHSAFLLALWDALDRRQLAALRRETAALDAAMSSQEKPPQVTGPPFAFDDADAMFADFVEVWARSSLEMENLCRGQGIEYLHFLQPNQYFEGSKVLNENERRVAWDADVADAGRVATGYPLLVARGRELAGQGVDFHDLTMLFHDDAGDIYSDPCCHFTQRGAERVAEAIAAAIIARNHP